MKVVLLFLTCFFANTGMIDASILETPFHCSMCDKWDKSPFPIGFSIASQKVVSSIPKKDKDFAYIIPGDKKTYIYYDEGEYYKDYQRSYFGITKKKAGWDCMRHYEILANGCIPYFLDIDKCSPQTMHFIPRKLIKEAMSLPGVSYRRIDHSKFDKERYNEILNKLLDYTRQFLTAEAMGTYVLNKINYSGDGKVLFLSRDIRMDYLRCSVLIGLKLSLGDKIIDVPKVPHIYTNYSLPLRPLYGRGFTCTKIVEDLAVDRSNVEERIKNKEFELIIYGEIHRGNPYIDLVHKVYPKEKIIYFCGQDQHKCPYRSWFNLFLREFEDQKLLYTLKKRLK